MEYTRQQLVNVLRDALECLMRHARPFDTHLPGGHVNVPAFEEYFLLTAGVVNSGISDEKKPIARHFENFDDPEKRELIEEALCIYRAPAVAGQDSRR